MKRSDSQPAIRRLIDSGDYASRDGIVAYRIFRDRRVRGCRLRWTFGTGLSITIPWRASSPGIVSILSEKQDWLLRCIREDRSLKNTPGRPKLESGGCMLYLGRMIPIINHEKRPGHPEIVLEEDRLLINSDAPVNTESRIVGWLKKRSLAILPGITSRLSAELNVPVRKITIRDQRSRWASWSSRKTISLNWRLIMAPPDVIDYVILHELTHDRHPNHSKRFWDALDEKCCHRKLSRQWLKSNSLLLSLFR